MKFDCIKITKIIKKRIIIMPNFENDNFQICSFSKLQKIEMSKMVFKNILVQKFDSKTCFYLYKSYLTDRWYQSRSHKMNQKSQIEYLYWIPQHAYHRLKSKNKFKTIYLFSYSCYMKFVLIERLAILDYLYQGSSPISTRQQYSQQISYLIKIFQNFRFQQKMQN